MYRLNPAHYHFAIEEQAPDYDLFFNRMSPSAYLRNGVQGIFYTLSYLKHLETLGIRTINGYKAFTYETSKAQQLTLIHSLGYAYPKSRVVNHTDQIIAALDRFAFSGGGKSQYRWQWRRYYQI